MDYSTILYTPKEHAMHVYGPKAVIDRTILDRCSPKGSLDTNNALDFYYQGFYIAQNLLSEHLMDSARVYIDENYLDWLQKSRRQDDWRMHLNLDLGDLSHSSEHAPILNLVLQCSAVLERLVGLMGCPPSGFFYNQVAFRTPSSSSSSPSSPLYTPGAEYHIDGQANSQGTRFPDPFTLLVGVALVDIPPPGGWDGRCYEEMKGNFTVFPGGHATRCWEDYPALKRDKALPSLTSHPVALRRGDVVFCHPLLPHRGGRNTLPPSSWPAHTYSVQTYSNETTWLQNISGGIREMVFFRVRGKDFCYTAERGERLLRDIWCELRPVVELVQQQQQRQQYPEEI